MANLSEIFSTSKARTRAAREQEKHFGSYTWGYCTDIFEAYSKPSREKIKAWEYCKDLCAALDGYMLTITAHGCQTFSVCFYFPHPESGKECFAYITRDYNSFCICEN